MTQQEFLRRLEDENINISELPALLVGKLKGKGLKVATAESCTGGLISKLITDIPGTSEVFDCGICSYANQIKHRVLGVSEQTLAQFGAVSQETAAEMAKGVRTLANADIGVSVTGIAGPTGAVEGKPVGLVYIGVCTHAGTSVVKAELTAKNDIRDKNRQIAAALAIYCVIHSI